MAWEWRKAEKERLASFVNDAVARFIKLPVNPLELSRQSDGCRQTVQAIYNALVEKEGKVRYALEKYHPSDAIQQIREPAETLDTPGEGTCLDLAVLFCGACLGYDLLPLVVVTEGHALAAV
jgi:hypothetical protein